MLHSCVVVNTDRTIEVGTSATFIVTTVLPSDAAFGSVFSLDFWLRYATQLSLVVCTSYFPLLPVCLDFD